MVIETNSPAETEEAGRFLAQKLKAGDVVALYGELGAGKTRLVSGLAAAFGFSGITSSPTFTIVNEYDGEIPVFHFDVYRISSGEEMFDIGFEDYLARGGVTVIEWPQNIEGILPKGHIKVFIDKNYDLGDSYRKITISEGDCS